LEAFLKRPAVVHGLGRSVAIGTPWQVRTESVTEFGNLDIVLLSPMQGVKIVIENKIGAADQPEQLLRYWRWLNREALTVKLLCYLTPSGVRSVEADAHGVPYVILSYREDVRGMLREGIRQVAAPRLREILQQYADIVANL
jgi:hypothetical protein